MTGVTDDRTQSEGGRQKQSHQLLNRGAELLSQGRAQEAIAPLERAYQIAPISVPILINLGGAYVMTGRHQEAIPLLETASQAEPQNAMVWINLGAAYLGNPVLATHEQQMQAISAFEQALKLDPGAPSVHYNLGLIFVDRGEKDLAIAAFRKASQINPQDQDAQIWLRRLESGEGANADD